MARELPVCPECGKVLSRGATYCVLHRPRKGVPKKTPQAGTPEYEQWKRNLSEAHKGKRGHPAWNKGIPLTDKQKEAVRNAHLGTTARPETKAKMSASRMGREFSSETRAKIGAKHKGKIVSEETKQKQSQARTGKPQKPEVVERRAQTIHRTWVNKSDEQKAVQIACLMNPANQKTSHTRIEEVIASELDAQGTIYERQKRIGWYRVDFYIPATNTVIEANGCYWHGCLPCGFNWPGSEKKREADAKRTAYLERKGYKVEIIWEHAYWKMRGGRWTS